MLRTKHTESGDSQESY